MALKPHNIKIYLLAKDLYLKNKWSVPKISKHLNISLFRIYRLFRVMGLKRRTPTESNRINYEVQKPSFVLKEELNSKNIILKILGISLYWCEGSKWEGANQVDFANSDPKMIIVFMRFLRNICGVNEKKLRGSLYCYSNHNVKLLEKYWSRITGISLAQFQKSYVRTDFRNDKKHKMPHGLFHIRYADKKLVNLLKLWIEDYSNKWVGGRVVNCT